MDDCEKTGLPNGKGTFQDKDTKMKRLVKNSDVLCLYLKSKNRNVLLSGCNKQLGR